MKKIVKAVVGFLALLTAGCDNCKHCSCGHHDHQHEAISWKKDGVYRVAQLDKFDKAKTDDCVVLTPREVLAGFIGTCYGRQVDQVIKKHFGNEQEIIVLELDPEVLKANGIEVRAEYNKPGGDLFVHLYGTQKIPLAAVKEVKTLKKDEHGKWEEKK